MVIQCLVHKYEFAGSSLCRITTSRLARLLYKCVALCRAVYGPFATERPLGTVREEKGISSRYQGFYDMT